MPENEDLANRLYYGDCLDILRLLPASCADLIYLDPPFNSKRDYNAFLTASEPKGADAQITAFKDTWWWGEQAEREYAELLANPGAGALGETIMPALRGFLAQSDMMAYLTMMASRLIEMRRVLKETGSIYLHCDPTASHYLKIIMDGILGPGNFRNEIVWCYRGAGYPKRDFGRRHDIIFRYSKGKQYVFNLDDVRTPYAKATEERFKHKIGNVRKGIDYGDQSLHPAGKHPDDWWEIQPIAPSAKDRLGYPTQKPLGLLERIVLASSNAGDIVLDPFCGCGTSLHAAEKLGRKWIGIDITHLAIGLIRQRLQKAFPNCRFREEGMPKDLASARVLATSNGLEGRYQFQYWALFLAGALPSQNKKKGADKGVDGFIWFFDSPEAGDAPKKIIFSVKSGKIPPGHIRELAGLLKEPVEIAVLLTLEEPSRPMLAEAAAAGYFIYANGYKVPRIQIITVENLLAGQRPGFMDYGDGRAMNRQAAREAESGQEKLM